MTTSLSGCGDNTTKPPVKLTLTGFSPTEGAPGTVVTLTGTGFSIAGWNTVKFGDVNATVSAGTTTFITATVPENGKTGKLTVSNGDDTVLSSDVFTVLASKEKPPTQPPIITDFSPLNGPIGTTLTIKGENFFRDAKRNTVSIGSGLATIIAATPTSLTVTVTPSCKTGLIDVSTVLGHATTTTNFTVSEIPDPPDPIAVPVSKTQINLSWKAIQLAVGYNIYRSTTSGVATTSATKINKSPVANPSYADKGLTTGTTYYYVVTSVGTDGESKASKEVSATPTLPPPAPPTIVDFSPINGPIGSTVTIHGSNFSPIATNNSVTFGGGVVASVVSSTTTSIVVTVPPGAKDGKIAVTTGAGSATSISPFAVLLPPQAPTKVTAIAVTTTQISLNWSLSTKATGYNIYRSTTPGVALNASTKITSTPLSSSPYTDTGLVTGTTYYYVVTAVGAHGESKASQEVSATPSLPPPAPPTITFFSPTNGPIGAMVSIQGTNFSAMATNNTVTFGGGAVAIVNSATTTSLVVIVPAGAEDGPLTVITAVGTAKSSSPFVVLLPPKAPTSITAIAVDKTQVSLSWALSTGATGYNVYRSTSTGVAVNAVNKITSSPVSVPPYTDSGRTTGTTYYYVVTAIGTHGESQTSQEVSATPTAPPPAPPTITGFSPTNGPIGGTVTVQGTNFSPLATNNTVTFGGGAVAIVSNATASSLSVTVPIGATDGSITVITAAGTAKSTSPFVVLLPPEAPSGVTAMAVNTTQVSLSWSLSTGASGYNIYRSNTPGVAVNAINKINATPFASPPYTDMGRTTGTTYYYVVTAIGTHGESQASKEVSATPTLPPPAPPTITGFSPTNGPIGGTVTIQGSNFSPLATNNTVSFGGGAVAIVNNATASALSVTVPIGATNGSITVITAAGTAKSTSPFVVLLPPEAPSGVTAIGVNTTQVSLSWSLSTGASGYNIYRSNTPGVAVNAINKINATPFASPPYTDMGLTTGTTYYYVVTAIGTHGESQASKEVSATPTLPPPAPPTITGFSPTNGPIGGSVTIQGSNFSPLATNNTVSFGGGAVAVVNSATATALSVTVPPGAKDGPITVITAAGTATSASPFVVLLPPKSPSGVTAIAVDTTQVSLSWNLVTGATGYNIYRSTTQGVTANATNRITSPPVTLSPYTDSGRTTGTTYYYVVTAVGPHGESKASQEVSATPTLPPPAPPTITGFSPGNGPIGSTITIQGTNFSPLANNNTVSFGGGAVAVVNSATTSTLSVTVPPGAVDGIITIITATGTAKSTSPFVVLLPPKAPTGVAALAVNTTQISLSWNLSTGATGYNVYRSTTQGVATNLANRITANPVSAPPLADPGLTTGTTYYYVVTAIGPYGESAPSGEVSATPVLPPPAPPTITDFSPTNGPIGGTVTIHGSNFASLATNNNVSFGGAISATINSASTTTLVVTVPAGAITGKISVTTARGTAETAAPFVVNLPPDPPTGLTATTVSGSQITVSWSQATSATGYHVYRSTQPSVATAAGNRITTTPVAGPSFTDTGLSPGVTYYYVVTALNANGESAASNEANATTPTALPAPGGVGAVAGVGEITISWDPVAGATSYNLYYTTGSTTPTTSSTKIANVSSPYTHTNLPTGTQHNYVVTAQNALGESAASGVVSATPAIPVIVARVVSGIPQTILQSNVEVSVKDNFGDPIPTATVSCGYATPLTNLAWDATRSIYKGYINFGKSAKVMLSVTINGSDYSLPSGVTEFTDYPKITSAETVPSLPFWTVSRSMHVIWDVGFPVSDPATHNDGIIIFDTVSVNPYWTNSLYWNNYIAPKNPASLTNDSDVPPNVIARNLNIALVVYINKTETVYLDGDSTKASVGSIDIIGASPVKSITTY